MKIFLASIFLFATQMAFAQLNDSFRAVTPSREIMSGVKCKGGEQSGVSERWCKTGQWLITLNSEPFIVKLKRVNTRTPSTMAYFEIIPKDFVTSNTRKKLGRYWVKFEVYGEPGIGLSYFYHTI